MSPTLPKPPSLSEIAAAQGDAIDSRYHPSAAVRRQLNKVFPTHWSFLLGEIALYSFIVLLLTGVYLSLFFDPSMVDVTYDGVYQPLRGVEMSEAFASTLDISFEVRGGLFVRQIHHWAALLFAASIMVHLARIFFTGAFRRPREANWVIGSLLLILAMFEGFFGYSLPDDLLSGTGLRAAFSGITMGMPVIGTWLHWALFGGDFPCGGVGNDCSIGIIIPRLYALHILLIPGIILALIGAHLALVWFQKHTQFPGPGRTETNVVGVRVMPVFAVKSGAFFAVTTGILGLMGGLLQINPIWQLGPYKPSQISAGSQPDFYMMWTDGLIRLWPAWEFYPFGHTIPQPVWIAAAHGRDIHAAAGVAVPGEEVHRRQGAPQSAAAAPRRSGAYRDRRDGHRVLHRADVRVHERHHRAQVPHLAERDDMDRPHRHGGAARDRLLHRLPVVHRAAAQRPRGARARHRDGHHQAPAARRLRRAAPAAGAGRRPRPSDSAGVPGRRGAQADEQARLRAARRVPAASCGPIPATEHEAFVEAAHAAERKALTALREHQDRNGSTATAPTGTGPTGTALNGHGSSNGH